jgi:hypothetical protein
MSRRQGQITLARLQREWPHHVALPAEALRNFQKSETVFAFLKAVSAGPRPYHLRRGDREIVVFCFAASKDAETFHARFGSELLPAGR